MIAHRQPPSRTPWALFALSLGCLVASAPRASSADDPKALLAEVASAYKSLKSYQDHGELVLGLILDGKTHRTTQPVSILLDRPNRLIVEAGAARLVCDGNKLTTLVGPTRKYASSPAPKTVLPHHVTEGPVGSLLLGGPGGPPMSVVLGLLLADDPSRAVLDIGDNLSVEPDSALDGQNCRVLQVTNAAGSVFRLLIDPDTKRLRGIDVSLSPDALATLLPLGDRVKIETYRWRAGEVSTDPPPAEAFALEVPKDFAKLGALSEKKPENPEAGPKFAIQEWIGKPAPDFTLTILDGEGKTKTVSRADLAGKVVMIDFWATWCGPCLEELPEVQTLIESYAKSGQAVVVVALSQDNDPKDPVEVRRVVEATLEKKGINLTLGSVGKVGIDPSNSVGSAFQVQGYPSVVILDGEGVVRAAHVGFSKEVGKTLKAEIDGLLEAKPKS